MKLYTRQYHSAKLAIGVYLGFCLVQPVWADAGSLLQQNEQSIKPHLPATDALRLLNFPPPMTLSDQFRMNVRRVYFLGNSRINKNELYPAVQPFLNRSITPLEIDKMKVAVTNVYRQAGWIVEVYLPQQTLDQNELTLQIVEDLRHSGKPAR
jgi:hemolysin activation/secretion protein